MYKDSIETILPPEIPNKRDVFLVITPNITQTIVIIIVLLKSALISSIYKSISYLFFWKYYFI